MQIATMVTTKANEQTPIIKKIVQVIPPFSGIIIFCVAAILSGMLVFLHSGPN